jgi:PhnB protein
MDTKLNPYINFKANAREAFEYYQSVLGGELEMHTYGEFRASEDPTEQDKIMHAMLTVSDTFALMGADTPNKMQFQPPAGISVSLSGTDAEKLRSYFEAFSRDGTVTMPLEKQMWGDEFGMCLDKFGVHWMFNIHTPEV